MDGDLSSALFDKPFNSELGRSFK